MFRGRDAATVTAMYHAACDMLAGCCPRAAAVLEEAEPDALAYLDFPPAHWKRLRTNNVQERTNREINVSVNLFFTSFAKQARRLRKGGFTGCANVFSPIPVTARRGRPSAGPSACRTCRLS